MSKEATHLIPAAAKALELPDEERIRFIERDRWIGYSRAQKILDKMEHLLDYPKKYRMPNLLIIGDTNNGKTSLLKKFEKMHPAEDRPDQDCCCIPVLYVQISESPDLRSFLDEILNALFSPGPKYEHISVRRDRVMKLLKTVQLKMLIIDEINNLIAGHKKKQRQFLNFIKYLGNALQIPIAGAGVQNAVQAVQSDPQLSNRFEPVFLPRWKMDKEFLSLLASFERMIPLKEPSFLYEKKLAIQLHSMCEGPIGELASLLESAAIYAIHTGKEKIDRKVLAAIDWIPASKRKERAGRGG